MLLLQQAYEVLDSTKRLYRKLLQNMRHENRSLVAKIY